jgi:hypothetical protein
MSESISHTSEEPAGDVCLRELSVDTVDGKKTEKTMKDGGAEYGWMRWRGVRERH